MSEFIWPLTLLAVSVIWAYAWVTVEKIKYTDDEGFDIEEPEEKEDD